VNIGIVCYASVGGSGIVATSLAQSLAARGHDVHVLSADTPFRLAEYQPGLSFHRVHTPAYPLFREPQYLLSLANRIVQVARDVGLDIVHAHYAVPHAMAVYLARQILIAARVPLVPQSVTTLHGTDITVVGGDPSYSETVAFSIDQSDGVTAVSESLRKETYRVLPVQPRIEVVPNFLDCGVYRWVPADPVRSRYSHEGREKLVVHVSNFRPVKRVKRVIDVFTRIAGQVPARLLLVGDGPDLGAALQHAKDSGVGHLVESLGEQDQIVPLLSAADVFLLPSEQESFGLAALEAMACELPVVASRVGGLPEVIQDDVSGFLRAQDDVEGMAECAVRLLTDRSLHARIAAEGRRTVEERFCSERIVPRYEALYERLLRAR
jgi:L-malate glycosyltransferase